MNGSGQDLPLIVVRMVPPQFGTARSGKNPEIPNGFRKIPNRKPLRRIPQEPLNQIRISAAGGFKTVGAIKPAKNFRRLIGFNIFNKFFPGHNGYPHN
jgi:hypothetical protein